MGVAGAGAGAGVGASEILLTGVAASLAVATSPVFACTGISLKSQDGAAIRGRILEFGFPLKSNVMAVPAGQAFSATLPDGSKGLSYKTRYGIVGGNAVNEAIVVDGLNDQGLSIGLFYLPVTQNMRPRPHRTDRVHWHRKILACGRWAISPRLMRSGAR